MKTVIDEMIHCIQQVGAASKDTPDTRWIIEILLKQANEIKEEYASQQLALYKESEQPDVNNEMEIMKSAWPPRDIVEKLTIAADILLHKKDYDGHGWEEIEYCWRLAKEWLQSIKPAKGNEIQT